MRHSMQIPRPAGRLLAILTLIGLSGCQGVGTPVGNEYDPLVGGSPISRIPPGSLPYPGRPAPPSLVGDVPPPPPSGNATSPAALATAGIEAPPERRASAIGVTLHDPRTAGGGSIPSKIQETSNTPITTSAAVPSPGSYEEMQIALRARGVVFQQLKSLRGEEWQFICAIPPDPQQPNVRRNFDVKAVGPFGLAAMRAAIEEIDRTRK